LLEQNISQEHRKNKELRQTIVTNFADKREKGFPFPSTSIASLHVKSALTEVKNIIFMTRYFGKQKASAPLNTGKQMLAARLFCIFQRRANYAQRLSSELKRAWSGLAMDVLNDFCMLQICQTERLSIGK